MSVQFSKENNNIVHNISEVTSTLHMNTNLSFAAKNYNCVRVVLT